MNLRFLVVLLVIAAPLAVAQPVPATDAIDAHVTKLMDAQDVKGLAIAVIDQGRVVHVAAYGLRNVEKDEPLGVRTVMYGASFTKTAFAYMVLQLADEGLIDLDQALADYLPKPLTEYPNYADLAGDDRWSKITARHVLTHSTGFHNFRWLEDDGQLRIHFDPGERYAYSGEGFNLLQLVLEEGLELDVGAEMQTRIFDRFGMPKTSMQWRDDFADNLADGYAMDGSFEAHDQRSRVSAAGSMDTTISDQGRMWSGILNGWGLSEHWRDELIRPQLAINTAHQFPSLIEEKDVRAQQIGLAAGLGLVTFGEDKTHTWFKGGHDDWTGNFAVCLEFYRRCVVLMANSVRAELIYPRIVQFVLPGADVPWWWEYRYDELSGESASGVATTDQTKAPADSAGQSAAIEPGDDAAGVDETPDEDTDDADEEKRDPEGQGQRR